MRTWMIALSLIPPAGPSEDAFPLGRTSYFRGESILLSVPDPEGRGSVRLEAVREGERLPIYSGSPGPVLLDASRLAPGDYALERNGAPWIPRMTIVDPLRRSAASLQDETPPAGEHAPLDSPHWEGVARDLRESGIDMLVHLGAGDVGRLGYLDALARAGAMALANPDTRPTSFCPTRPVPEELESMSHRLVLAAQANGRHPNFGGFCYGWDTCGFATGGRKLLLVYWGWEGKETGLRNYIERIDRQMADVFRRRAGLEPVGEGEYIRYLVSLRRPEFAPAIDLPTRRWLREIAGHSRPMDPAEREAFEKRLDAWSSFLMAQYGEVYGGFSRTLREISPSLRHTASVQVDHCAVREGQYLPSAYAPLDLRYQSVWNDQVGGPDYAYQWLLTAGLLDMGREGRPTWLSNTLAAAHGRAPYPGKFTRVAAHGLAWGVSGIGFALEGFSNLLGGMNKHTHWSAIRDRSGGADARAGRDFLDRFCALALEGRGDHGAAILFPKSQFARQHTVLGFGQPHCWMFVALTRLGYTPRFVTEEELAAGKTDGIKSLIVIGQTVPLPGPVLEGIHRYVRAGGRVPADATTSVPLPGAGRLEADLPFSRPGKPHSWTSPNMAAGDNDALMFSRWYRANAPGIAVALGDAGRAALRPETGPLSPVSVLQIDGGRDARYLVAVNDSHVATQADWFQVRERLVPTGPTSGALYDLTEEKPLGPLGPVECDLSAATARVFGILARPCATIDLSARQDLKAGDDLVLAVRFLDPSRARLEAVIPFHLEIRGPDGRLHQEFYRATGPDGLFSMTVPLPANIPPGRWTLSARCQLDGTTARLPLTVSTPAGVSATGYPHKVLVRGRGAMDPLFQKGGTLVVPIFKSSASPAHRSAAERARSVLAARGVEVEIRTDPTVIDYVLSYDPGEAEKAANAKADRGEAFGVLRRRTVNRNDWFAALSGWRFGRPVLLFDLAGTKGDNPMAESLEAAGLLWPRVTPAFPGPGRAVVQGIHWAFAPRVNAIVIQAWDPEGLAAGAEALADLPEDRLTPGIEAVRRRLWQERRVGGAPDRPPAEGLGRDGIRVSREPRPFRQEFPEGKPPTPEEARERAPRSPEPRAIPLPASVDPRKEATPFYFDDHGTLIETATAEFLVPDMRFHDALRLVVEVPKGERIRITLAGLFRSSDRPPRSQAQWEDLLKLHREMVPPRRAPMEVDVLAGGRSLGRLTATKMEFREVPVETSPSLDKKGVRTVEESVAVELSGEVDLPPGRHEIFLVHRNIVDGRIEGIGIGMPPAPKPEKKR